MITDKACHCLYNRLAYLLEARLLLLLNLPDIFAGWVMILNTSMLGRSVMFHTRNVFRLLRFLLENIIVDMFPLLVQQYRRLKHGANQVHSSCIDFLFFILLIREVSLRIFLFIYLFLLMKRHQLFGFH